MLEALISECTDYDFKEKLEIKKAKSWLKSISAFANGIGGSLFFGVSDDKKLLGINNPQYICDKISELINSKITPIPSFILEPHNEKGLIFIIVKVFPGPSTPYYYSADGVREAYFRSGIQSVVAPRHVLEELILKGQNKTYDSIVTSYLKKDYSFTFFEATFFDKTFTRISDSDYISFSLMTREGYLTNAGVLLSDQNIYRQNRVFCTRWNGITKTSLEEAMDDAEYTGGLVKILESVLNFVKNNTKKKWKKAPEGRIEMPEYDEIAIREVIVNALIHRMYTNVGSEVTVDIYDDRIIVTSPGPMVSGMTFYKEPNTYVPSIRRNPILADIFARMKFMDRRGSGFDKILNGTNRLFNDNKNHVEFNANNTHFTVVIFNANYKKGKEKGKENGKEIVNEILEQLLLNEKVTVGELAEILSTTAKTIRYYMSELREQGVIVREGSTKSGKWVVLTKFNEL